jgi:Secretion system C-terminal sorting domain
MFIRSMRLRLCRLGLMAGPLFAPIVSPSQTPPLPDEGCRIRYRYDEAGNRTRREWQCWVVNQDPDDRSSQQSSEPQISAFDDNDLLISPNPASDQVSVRLSKPLPNATVEILDMNGHVLRTTPSGEATTIPIGDLAEGSYALRVITTGEMLITTFIVLR